MADLSEKVAEEQQQFIRAQWLDAQDAERFRYMDPRVETQLQVCGAETDYMKTSWPLCTWPKLPLAQSILAFLDAPLADLLKQICTLQSILACIVLTAGITAKHP